MRRDLYDDLKEKNAVARSTHSGRSGKSRYMMPSDYLSAAEKKKLNGEIVMYEMKVPISWAKFKSYPKDIQKEYLQWFADEFSASSGMMAKIFELAPTYCATTLRKMGLGDVLCRQPTVVGRKAFDEWLKQYRPEEESEEKPPVEEPKKKETKPMEQPMFFNTITGCEMSMEGKASEIGQMLFNMFRDQKISVSISFVVDSAEVAEV